MKKLQLLLTDPCSLNWDDMPQAGAGRYCDNCEKHIVDLTAKSDAELIQFFHTKKANVCGRLLSTQLNRELVLPAPKPSWQWLLPLAIGAMIVSPAQANELKPVVMARDLANALPVVPIDSPAKLVAATIKISGKVVDEFTGEPLKGVKVKQKGFENVLAFTDSAGVFKLAVSEGNLATTFTFELSEYTKVESKLNNGMVVKMSMLKAFILGGISTISLHQEPLYIVAVGKRSCTMTPAKFKELSPDWIEKIEVLKGASATALYGSKAANGAVLIEIKKAYAKHVNFSNK